MRVIFDRSSFHGGRFKTLVDSPLRSLVKSGQLKVFLTPVFIEETLNQYGSARAGDDWREHLKFAVETCNGGVLLDKTEIWRNELVSGEGAAARYLRPERSTRRYGKSRAEVLARLLEIADTADMDEAWQASANEREEVQQKKNNQRELYVKIRGMVSEAMRHNSYARSSWKDYTGADFLKVGRYLMKLVDKRRQIELGDVWERDPWHYPHYSAFIQGLMYAIFHAAEKPNEKIDRNSQADYEQLAYLTGVDAIVSNDEKFLGQAFNTIWAPRNKRFFTTQQFVDFADAILR